MKFDLVSDLHLSSYYDGDLRGLKPASPVLALLGDVCEVIHFKRIKKFFEYVSANWTYVLYVPGNHEFYGNHLEHTIPDMRRFLESFRNIVILDNDVVAIDNVRYIGSTLWSDMNREDPLSMLACEDLINDYRYIAKTVGMDYKRIVPKDTVRLYDKNVDFIKVMLEISGDPLNVVLTHHAPSYQSVSPRFKGNAANGAFVSNLEDFILDRPKILVWAHGHTHAPVDYQIGDCRVVANPLGYGRELYKNDNEYKPVTIEVLK
jgi:predicted phosphodiesterase